MKSKHSYLLLFFLLIASQNLFAQGEANMWYFGYNAAVDFNSGAPVVLTNSAMSAFEGCASIADAGGALRFYTDGITVWNKNHVQMFNGFGLMGDPSSTQSGVIVPQPGNPDIYYIFTVDEQAAISGFRYSIVDMSLQGGLGEVTVKNIPILYPSTEKVTATEKSPGEIWVMTHQWNSNAFYAYVLDASGFNATPVISNVGTVHNGNNENTIGYMKFSPDGNRIGYVIYHILNLIEVFDFDKSTGIVSNSQVLYNSFPAYGAYGMEFSPNSQLIYATNVGLIEPSYLYQWNLAAGSLANIQASMVTMGNLSNAGALQLAPDGKMYLSQTGTNYLGVVNYPDVAGTGCDFLPNAVFLQNGSCSYGLPDFISTFFLQAVFTYEGICFGDSTLFTIQDTTDIDSVLWVFDDPNSGTADTTTAWTPHHVFTDTGTYSVQLYYWYSGTMDTDIVDVVIYPVPNTDLGNDTIICTGDQLFLDASFPPNSSYLWQDGSTDSFFIASSAGTYFVDVTSSAGCINHDTIQLGLYPLPIIDLGNDTLLCDGQTLTLDASASGIIFLWQDGSVNPTFTISSQGMYWVNVTDTNTCSKADSMIATYVPIPPLNLGNDTLICLGDALLLSALYPGVTYQWNNGSTNPDMSVSSTGVYWVSITDANHCVNTDTFNLGVLPPPAVDLGDEVHYCFGDYATLDATTPDAFTYFWWDGTTNATHTVATPGTYYVEVTNIIGCKGWDTVDVFEQPLPIVDLGNDTLLCNNATLLLDPLNTDKYHQWQDGSNTQTYTVTQPGTYSVTVIDLYGCTTIDQIEVTYQATPKIDLGNDSLWCYGDRIVLDAFFPDASYIWNDGKLTSTDTAFMKPGIFHVDVTNQCGTYSDSVKIDFHNCQSCVNVPNVFTPNFDGLNDEFKPLHDCNVAKFNFQIFNRWGQVIFESHDIEQGWNGKHQGKSSEMGTYAWYLTYENADKPGTEYFLEGYVVLAR